MGFPSRLASLVLLLVALCGTAARADNGLRTYRVWDSFPVGAWKHVRTYRESFDENGKLLSTSTADTKTTLVAIDDKGFTLRSEVTYEVNGKRFNPPHEVLWFGYHGEPKGEEVKTEKLGTEIVEIDGLKLDADVYRFTFQEGERRREIRAHLSEVFPYLLRKESVLLEPMEEKPREVDSLSTEVLNLQLPYKVLAELQTTSHVRTNYRNAEYQMVTVEVHCQQVPGSVVAHWSRKTFPNGQVQERSTLELIDYGVANDDGPDHTVQRRPFFRRNR